MHIFSFTRAERTETNEREQGNLVKPVMPDLIRHPDFSLDSGFRRNDKFHYLIAGSAGRETTPAGRLRKKLPRPSPGQAAARHANHIRAFSKAAGNGFTLLEVIIVLALATLVLGLTAVHFAGYLPAAKFDAAGRELSALIRHARSLARLNGETERLVINLDDGTYGMENRPLRKLPPHVLVGIIDPFAGEIRQGKYSFVFHPTGDMEGGAIVLAGGKKKLRIDLDPVTGAVLLK